MQYLFERDETDVELKAKDGCDSVSDWFMKLEVMQFLCFAVIKPPCYETALKYIIIIHQRSDKQIERVSGQLAVLWRLIRFHHVE